MTRIGWLTLLLLIAFVSAKVVLGQEMEPRAYSPAPIGTQFVLLSYGYQSGDVLLDASVPLKDVSINLNAASVGYGRTFSFATRQTNVAVLFPYLWGTAQGTVFEDQVKVRRSGGGDLRFRFSTLLKGGEALRPTEFAQRKPRTLIGASVLIVVPTGQYDPQRLVNPGSNRWAFKPEIGISKPVNRWTFEVMGGAWFFAANNSFLGASRRSQKPMASFQGSVIYTLRRRMWQSIKIAWAKGVTTRIGGNLNTIVAGWQYAWF